MRTQCDKYVYAFELAKWSGQPEKAGIYPQRFVTSALRSPSPQTRCLRINYASYLSLLLEIRNPNIHLFCPARPSLPTTNSFTPPQSARPHLMRIVESGFATAPNANDDDFGTGVSVFKQKEGNLQTHATTISLTPQWLQKQFICMYHIILMCKTGVWHQQSAVAGGLISGAPEEY